MYQGTALNTDERDWLTDVRRERQEVPSEEPSFGLALLVSMLVANRQASELEYVSQRLWVEAQLKRLQEERL